MISSFITEASFTVEFPRLMSSIVRPGLIVLFSSDKVGTVVAVPHAEEIYTVGHHCAGWDPAAFEVFDGSLNLCNEADTFIDEGATAQEDTGEGHALGSVAGRCGGCVAASCGGCVAGLENQPEADKEDDLAVRSVSLAELMAILTAASSVQHA